MKVMLVPSAVAQEEGSQLQFLSSYLINETLAIDAGALGLYRTPQEQARVKHILISHTHIDHIATLPIFLENVYNTEPDCVTLHGSAAVLETLQHDIFNNRIWPDFISLSSKGLPFLKLSTLKPGEPVELEGLNITPIPVNHVVPTLGFVIQDQRATVLIPSDTAATEEIWQCANAAPNLKAVFLEASFPDAMAALAEQSKHLTPAGFARELSKLQRPVDLFAVHIKSLFRPQIVKELLALGLPNMSPARPGHEYEF